MITKISAPTFRNYEVYVWGQGYAKGYNDAIKEMAIKDHHIIGYNEFADVFISANGTKYRYVDGQMIEQR